MRDPLNPRSKSREKARIESINSREDGLSKQPANAEDIKQLELTREEILEKEAFIWVCGKNDQGELGLGNEDKQSLPKNVE